MSSHSPDPSDPVPDQPGSAPQVRWDVLRCISMDLNQIGVFIRVVDIGSVSGAAASLGCTPSDVSRRLRSFERELGASLLTHRPGEVRPTARGGALLPYLRVVLATVDALRHPRPPERPSG